MRPRPQRFRAVVAASQLPKAPQMRTCAVLLLGFLCLPACVTVTTGASRRVALAPSPGAPPQLRGSPGIGLATRIPLVDPEPGRTGNGIAVPVFQPELNGVFRFA